MAPWWVRTSRMIALPAGTLGIIFEPGTTTIAAVREGRGDKLRPEAAARLHSSTAGGLGGCFGAPGKSSLRRLVKKGAGLYDGSVYSGEVGLEVGLVDGVGELRTELQKRYGRFVRLETIAEDERGLDYHRLLRWLL